MQEDSANIYSSHFKSKKLLEAFDSFKELILLMELDCAMMVANIVSKQLKNKEIDVFEIGYGDGRVTQHFLSALQSSFTIISYEGVDVVDKYASLCDRLVNELISRDKIKIHIGDATTFATRKKYDIIVSFNSMYGVPFTEIQRYIEFLNSGGMLCIIANSRKGISMQLAYDLIEEPIITSEDICAFLDETHILYQAHLLDSKKVNRATFMDDDKLKQSAEGFLRYVLRKPKGTLNEAKEYLSRKDDSFFKLPQELIVISPQVPFSR